MDVAWARPIISVRRSVHSHISFFSKLPTAVLLHWSVCEQVIDNYQLPTEKVIMKEQKGAIKATFRDNIEDLDGRVIKAAGV